MTNFENNFDKDTKVRADDLGKREKDKEPIKSVSATAEQREISLTLFGDVADLCAYADTAISDGFVSEVHVTSEDGKPVMKMEYDDAVSAFLSDLAASDQNRTLEFKLNAK